MQNVELKELASLTPKYRAHLVKGELVRLAVDLDACEHCSRLRGRAEEAARVLVGEQALPTLLGTPS